MLKFSSVQELSRWRLQIRGATDQELLHLNFNLSFLKKVDLVHQVKPELISNSLLRAKQTQLFQWSCSVTVKQINVISLLRSATNTLNLLLVSPLTLFPLSEQISSEICINMQLESFTCASEQRCWLVFLLLKNSLKLTFFLLSTLRLKQEVFPELCCTDLSMNSCCIHPPLNNPSSTH